MSTDRDVVFEVDGTTTYGTLHIPAHRDGQRLPAALLLAAISLDHAVLDNPALVAPPHTLHVTGPLPLECGRVLPGHTVSFETYGTLSAARDNVILVCHSLTKGAHAAGRHAPGDPRPGWWDAAIGPGKLLDTDRYFVICAETLAAGRSTGPASPDPATGRPYGLRFPVVTVRDMVHAQQQLVTRFGIERLHAVMAAASAASRRSSGRSSTPARSATRWSSPPCRPPRRIPSRSSR
jgi:homoserine O-acetyltransferase